MPTIIFKIIATIYVDDTAVVFTSRNQLCKGMSLIQKLFQYTGIEIHTGKCTKESKTECVFVAAPGYFKQQAIENNVPANELSLLSENENMTDGEKDKRSKLEDNLYDNCQETEIIKVGDGFITYCKIFKYLGSWISYNLRNDYDIEKRIAAASKSMDALKDFFSRKEVSTQSKYLIFMAVPVSLLLWGCESWAVRKVLLGKLEQCVRRQIRNILCINMWHVKEQHITVEQLQAKFNNISGVKTLIDVRTMQLLGKLVRGPVSLTPRQVLIAFVPNTRPIGRPLKCNRESTWKSLQRLLNNIPGMHVNFVGFIKDWYLDALDSAFWNRCIEKLQDPKSPTPSRPNRDVGYNPRRSRRNRRTQDDTNDNNDTNDTNTPRDGDTDVSPPRGRRREKKSMGNPNENPPPPMWK